MTAAHCNQSLYGDGVVIMVQENILFDEFDVSTVSMSEVSEVVTISYHEF